MSINMDQFFSIDKNWSILHQHWSTVIFQIFIEPHWYQCLQFDRTLIHINWHCTSIHHVLKGIDYTLRILAMHEANTAKISNFYFGRYHLFKTWQTLFLTMVSSCKNCISLSQSFKWWFNSWITGQKVQKLQILLIAASYIASILKLNILLFSTICKGISYISIHEEVSRSASLQWTESISHLQNINNSNSQACMSNIAK